MQVAIQLAKSRYTTYEKLDPAQDWATVKSGGISRNEYIASRAAGLSHFDPTILGGGAILNEGTIVIDGVVFGHNLVC